MHPVCLFGGCGNGCRAMFVVISDVQHCRLCHCMDDRKDGRRVVLQVI